VTDVAYPNDGADSYSTVKRLLTRLEAKGFVRRDRRGPLLAFHATLDRNQLIARRLEALSNRLCGGAISPLLKQLAMAAELTESQRTMLLRLAEELE
jgi:predicted transcriptional regulator